MSNGMNHPKAARQPAFMMPMPLGPHPHTWGEPKALICSDDGKQIVVYCRRTSCGAVYETDCDIWTMWSPISLEDFVTVLKLHKKFASDQLDAWVVGLVVPAGTAKH